MSLKCYCGEPCFKYTDNRCGNCEVVWKCSINRLKITNKKGFDNIKWEENNKKPCGFFVLEPQYKQKLVFNTLPPKLKQVPKKEIDPKQIILSSMLLNIINLRKFLELEYWNSLITDCRMYGFLEYDYSSKNIGKFLSDLEIQINEVRENISSHSFKQKQTSSFGARMNRIQSQHDPFTYDARGSGVVLGASAYDSSRWCYDSLKIKKPENFKSSKYDLDKLLS